MNLNWSKEQGFEFATHKFIQTRVPIEIVHEGDWAGKKIENCEKRRRRGKEEEEDRKKNWECKRMKKVYCEGETEKKRKIIYFNIFNSLN